MVNYAFFKRFFELRGKPYQLPQGGACAGYSWIAALSFYLKKTDKKIYKLLGFYLKRTDKKIYKLLKKVNNFTRKHGIYFNYTELSHQFNQKEQFELERLIDNIILFHDNRALLTGNNAPPPDTLAKKTAWVTDKIKLSKLPHVMFHLKPSQRENWSFLMSEYLKRLPKKPLIITCWCHNHAMAFVVNSKRNQFNAFEVNHDGSLSIQAKNLPSLEKKGAFDYLLESDTFYLQAFTVSTAASEHNQSHQETEHCLTSQAPFCDYIPFEARDNMALYGCHACLDTAHQAIPPDSNANKVLYFASKFGRTEIVESVLRGDYGPFTADYIYHGDQFTTLMVAAIGNHVKITELLLDYYTKHHHLDKKDLLAALVVAAQHGNEAIIALLLQHGVDVDAIWKDFSPPLVSACERHHPRCVDLLLKAGADPNLSDHLGHPPILWAVEKAHVEGVKLLLSHGADPAPQKSSDGYTPLSLARQHGNRAIVDLLTEATHKHRSSRMALAPS